MRMKRIKQKKFNKKKWKKKKYQRNNCLIKQMGNLNLLKRIYQICNFKAEVIKINSLSKRWKMKIHKRKMIVARKDRKNRRIKMKMIKKLLK